MYLSLKILVQKEDIEKIQRKYELWSIFWKNNGKYIKEVYKDRLQFFYETLNCMHFSNRKW